MSTSKRKVAYFYDEEIGNFYYGPQHPMKPHRIRMAHHLILGYGLYKQMEIYRPTLINQSTITSFHADDYVHFLQVVTPDNQAVYQAELARYNVDVDCFDRSIQLLTKDGFKFVEEIGMEDQIATYNPLNQSIEYHHPQAIVEKDGEHEMIEIETNDQALKQSINQSISMSVTAKHDMYVKRPNSSSNDQYSLEKAGDLLTGEPVFQFLTHAKNGVDQTYAPSNKQSVNQSLSFLQSDVQTNAFLELYGAFIGGVGTVQQSVEQSNTQSITFSFPQQSDQDRLIGMLKRCNFPINQSTNEPTNADCLLLSNGLIEVINPELVKVLSQSCKLIDQTVSCQSLPDWIWTLTRDQISCLINGLTWSATQSINQSFEASHVSSSEPTAQSNQILTTSTTLRDQLIILMLHAGYSAWFDQLVDSSAIPSISDSKQTPWSVKFSNSMTDCEPSIDQSANLSKRPMTGKVYCVDVPNHLVIARRAIRNEQLGDLSKDQSILQASQPMIIGNCPVFDGLYKFCQLSAGGSVGGAYKLNNQSIDLAINWSGGLHHAKKSEASGFCYVNDIVLAILELLKYHDRVLYIDIDIHHGDGVEEAFYTTDRVMTVSFHKFGDFFPCTGSVRDVGVGQGKNYALNFPLLDGMDDQSFENMFKTVMSNVMERYRPTAVVLQCGADSLTGDRLGSFNLTTRGHGSAVEYMKTFNVPMLLVGGGGYTPRNVSRCWAYETGVALGAKMSDELPYNNYYEYYGPDFQLHIQPSNMENQNTPKYIDKTQSMLLEILHQLPPVPSVQYSTMIPPDRRDNELEEEDGVEAERQRKDVRNTQAERDRRIEDEREFYDDEEKTGESVTKRSPPVAEQMDF